MHTIATPNRICINGSIIYKEKNIRSDKLGIGDIFFTILKNIPNVRKEQKINIDCDSNPIDFNKEHVRINPGSTPRNIIWMAKVVNVL